MDATPRSLLQRLNASPGEADWQRLVTLYEPFIHGVLQRIEVPDSDAGDLSQDVMTALVQELPGFRHSGNAGAFRAWLRQVVVNRARGYWRKKSTGPSQAAETILNDLADPSSGLSGEWDREHDVHVARQLLQQLQGEFTPMTWTAFRRQMIDGAKAAEIATELGTTVNAVLIAKSRVLKRLREEAAGLIEQP